MVSTRILAVLVLGILSSASIAQERTATKVSLEVTDRPVRELVGAMSTATGISVLATSTAGEALATVSLTDVELEVAVRTVAEAIDGSWLRTYVVEPIGQQAEEDHVEDVLMRLQIAWRNLMLSCSDEELNAFAQRAVAARGGPPSLPPPTPGGGMMFDPVQMLQSPFHAERISLNLQAVSVREALKQFTLQSGYVTLISATIEGQVTLDVTDRELGEVLDAICEPIGAQWRPLYVIGKARELAPEQIEQGFMQMLQRGAEEFWKLPPERRQEIIQRITDRLASLPPESRAAIANSPWASRIMGRVMQFVFSLTPEQRREIAPLLQGFGRLMGQ